MHRIRFLFGVAFLSLLLLGNSSAKTEVPMMTPRSDVYKPMVEPKVETPDNKPEELAEPAKKEVKEVPKPKKQAVASDIDIPMVQKSFSSSKADTSTVREFYYNPRGIFRINTREAMSTTIILPEGEVIKRIAIGDESSFVAEQVDNNMLMVFPQKVNHDSSITIISNSKRVYTFYIKSLSFEHKVLPDLVVRIKARGLGFDNSPNPEANPAINIVSASSINKKNNPAIDTDFLDEAPLNPEKINWNYRMKGNKSIAPTRVWSDGTFTYLDFTNKEIKKDAVAVYRVKDKVDTPVNVRWNKNILIVETVGNLTLLNGSKHTCIEFLL